MKIKIPGKTAQETRAIVLEEIRLTSDGIEAREQRIVGNYFLFVLRMRRCTPTRKAERENDRHVDMMYRKRNWRNDRWTGAVCFHGHKIFMQRLFHWYPEAIVRTAKAAYLGKESFQDQWARVGDSNVGSQMMPVCYADTCACLDDLDYPEDFEGSRHGRLTAGPVAQTIAKPKVFTLNGENIKGCPFTILVPEHYRHDGTCKCSNAEHRKMMIAQWEYTPESFAGIPLVD